MGDMDGMVLSVGDEEGVVVGPDEGDEDGLSVGDADGAVDIVGDNDGNSVGAKLMEGKSVGDKVGC